jgi:hypothetical protein
MTLNRITFGLLALLCLHSVSCAVYEARNSDDVDFFLAHNPEENGALMFYDPNQENAESDISDRATKLIGVFKNVQEEGRSEEEWVDDLNDKVHLMRVDATNLDNARAVEDYKVQSTPLLFLIDNGKIILMEEVTDKTFNHAKDILVAKKEQKAKAAAAKADADKAADSSADGSEDGAEDGSASDDDVAAAHKAADDALKALEELRKTFEQHLAVEEAQKNAEDAQKKVEEAQKVLEEATKKLQENNKANDKANNKNDDANSSNQNGGNNQNKNVGQNQNGANNQNVKVEYIPVYRRFDQKPTYQQTAQQNTQQQYTKKPAQQYTQQNQQQQVATRYVQQPQQQGYWTIVDGAR